jgi:tryptophan-rich sensory protein
MTGKDVLRLIVSIGVSQLAGLIGSFFTRTELQSTWYTTLQKPSFQPPGWLFGPVWITLYTLMGIAAFLVWRKGLESKKVQLALLIFLVQLVLNTLWSILFFGMHWPLGGLFDIILLWFAILLMIFTFKDISKPAAILLIPYILWVTFALVLNFELWRLNR